MSGEPGSAGGAREALGAALLSALLVGCPAPDDDDVSDDDDDATEAPCVEELQLSGALRLGAADPVELDVDAETSDGLTAQIRADGACLTGLTVQAEQDSCDWSLEADATADGWRLTALALELAGCSDAAPFDGSYALVTSQVAVSGPTAAEVCARGLEFRWSGGGDLGPVPLAFTAVLDLTGTLALQAGGACPG